jgi:hypothetical protein
MATRLQTRLADALERVRAQATREVVKATGLRRTDRELLLRLGYLQEICKGWHLLTRPGQKPGESTAWYASFWDFIAVYLADRFGRDYCLSAASSLDLQVGQCLIPRQVTVIASRGGATLIKLPHGTSLLAYQDSKNLPATAETLNGLRVMSLAEALTRMPGSFYENSPTDAEIALRSIKPVSNLIRAVLSSESTTVASRLAGAYMHLGERQTAREILDAARAAGLVCEPADPFRRPVPGGFKRAQLTSPYAGRIQSLFLSGREAVLKVFAGLPAKRVTATAAYLKQVESVYEHDAYNSLSIEGYRVTPELISQIRRGSWNPEASMQDQQQVAAMAAKGYLEAFRLVQHSVQDVLRGKPAAAIAERDYQLWYRALFSESVKAGLMEAYHLAGHRNGSVFIRLSRHVPPPAEAVDDAMKALLDALRTESEPIVQAVLGHWLFGFIHPYQDGNGRVARFFMNVLLAGGGYHWTIIRNERRKQYLSALETASTEQQVEPFARFIREEMLVDWAHAGRHP